MNLIKNSIPIQNKSMGDQISFTEWNKVVNQLSTQANMLTNVAENIIGDYFNFMWLPNGKIPIPNGIDIIVIPDNSLGDLVTDEETLANYFNKEDSKYPPIKWKYKIIKYKRGTRVLEILSTGVMKFSQEGLEDLINSKLDEINVLLNNRLNTVESNIDSIKLKDIGQDNKLDIIESIIDGVMLDVKIDNLTITRNESQEMQVNPLIIDQINDTETLANNKLDKKPDGTVDLITPLNKIDARYLDIDNELFKVVQTLPTTPDTKDINKIFLVPKDVVREITNDFDEFLWVNNAWEHLGTISIDLSNYYNKAQVDGLVGAKVDKNADITAGTFPKITYDKKGLVTGGSALAATDIPDLPANKITQSDTHRFVTDNEKSIWNNKMQGASSVNGLDMNDVIETGFYHGYNMTNSATQGISTFTVIKYSGDWITQEQTQIENGNPRIFRRQRYNGTTWSPWVEIAKQNWVYDAINNAIIAGINGGY